MVVTVQCSFLLVGSGSRANGGHSDSYMLSKGVNMGGSVRTSGSQLFSR